MRIILWLDPDFNFPNKFEIWSIFSSKTLRYRNNTELTCWWYMSHNLYIGFVYVLWCVSGVGSLSQAQIPREIIIKHVKVTVLACSRISLIKKNYIFNVYEWLYSLNLIALVCLIVIPIYTQKFCEKTAPRMLSDMSLPFNDWKNIRIGCGNIISKNNTKKFTTTE